MVPRPTGTEDGGEGDVETAAPVEEESYEELVVLDRAGRVHIPQEYLKSWISADGRSSKLQTKEF